MRRVPITILLSIEIVEKLEKLGNKNHTSLSATARELIEKGLLESGV